MRFFRERSKLGWIAVIAFAMQAMLAFAHTHEHTAPGTQFLQARAITFGAGLSDGHRPYAPDHRHHHRDDCAICWATSLVGSAVASAPPTIEHLPTRSEAVLVLPLNAQLRSEAPVHFRARAPPHHCTV